jgi:hypothetical protein
LNPTPELLHDDVEHVLLAMPAAPPRGVGSTFRSGSFTCTVYFVLEEDNKARCVHGRRPFRVDYGS